MAGSLSSGEDEAEFLRREAEVVGEAYANKYSREVEGLRKWTDAYVALVVSAALIVIVAVISMMIYEVGVVFVVALAAGMVGISCVGAWIILVSAPREIKTRTSGPSSRLQKLAVRLFAVMVPAAVIVSSSMVILGYALGWAILAAAALIFLPGFVARRDDGNLKRKDEAIPTVVRVLGRVTAATGSTVADSLDKLDRRSMGDLAAEATRLRNRLKAGIDPGLCWAAFVDEIGSELIERTVQMFWDSISFGGQPGEVGGASAFFSSRIVFLRATRDLVATTFQYPIYPLHIALVALLAFVAKIMGLFASGIAADAGALDDSSGMAGSNLAIVDLFTFGQVNMQMVNGLVTAVLVVLTFANSFAPKAASGGHNYKLLYPPLDQHGHNRHPDDPRPYGRRLHIPVHRI